MDIRPIETEADYDWALAEVERYFDAEPLPDTAEAARFSVLSALIGAYENKRWPIEAPTAVDAIKGAMELSGHSQTDLAMLLGSRSRASELLNHKRGLTMEQAWKLHTAWGIPAAALIRPSAKAACRRRIVAASLDLASKHAHVPRPQRTALAEKTHG